MDIYAVLPLMRPEERRLIELYHGFYRSLLSGARPATTAEQLHFIDACNGSVSAETIHEKAFINFRKLVENEREKRRQETTELDRKKNRQIEDHAGSRNYPDRMARDLDQAADWAAKNGFRLPGMRKK
jgi:uncharacterized protein YifE (UPF0438 family)